MNSTEPGKLPEHIERHFGKIDRGFSDKASGASRIQVVVVKDAPNHGIHTFITLGLSNHVLTMREGKEIRMELLLSALSASPAQEQEIASILLNIADYLLEKHIAVLRGEVVVPSVSTVAGGNAHGFYATVPAFFADEASVFNGNTPATIFVMVLPVTKEELQFIQSNGWRDFEEKLEQVDSARLFDLHRGPIL